jgi:hypothetical protein
MEDVVLVNVADGVSQAREGLSTPAKVTCVTTFEEE